MKKAKVRTKQYIDKNPIEAVLGIGAGVAKSVGNDVVKGVSSDFWNQFLGFGGAEEKRAPQTTLGGDLEEGQEMTLGGIKDNKKDIEKNPSLHIEPAIDYRREILHAETKVAQENTQEISRKIQEIIAELKQLTATSKELQIEFKEVAVEQRISRPGKYHVNFFEWVLSTIRLARMKVEDSSMWLTQTAKKHSKKGYYWTMSDERKGGTSFSLSSERVVATQTG